MMLGLGALGVGPLGVGDEAPKPTPLVAGMTPADVKAAIHVIDDRVEAWRQERAAADAAFERAHAALRQAVSNISVGAPDAAALLEQLPAIKAQHKQAVANLRGLVLQVEDIARDLRYLARQVVGES